jgi:hypothetical protein
MRRDRLGWLQEADVPAWKRILASKDVYLSDGLARKGGGRGENARGTRSRCQLVGSCLGPKGRRVCGEGQALSSMKP